MCNMKKCREGTPDERRALAVCLAFLRAVAQVFSFDPLDFLIRRAQLAACEQIAIPDLDPAPLVTPADPILTAPCKALPAMFDAGPYYIGGECVVFYGV